jgi:aspartate aminotransferase
MMAPATGFYSTQGLGLNEVRLAYVLNQDDLKRALICLEKALQEYPGRKEY